MVEEYACAYTVAELEVFLKGALESARESAVITRSYEGSSMTFDPATAKQTAKDLGAALTRKRAACANQNPILAASPWSTGVDFSTRQIE